MPINLDLANDKDLIVGERFPKLELKMNETALICLLTKEVVASLCHYIDKMGYFHCAAKANNLTDMANIQSELGRPDECFLCKVSNETQGKVNPPTRRFGTKVLRYKTDVSGKPLTVGGLQMWLEIFLMGPDKFRQIMAKQKEWGDLRNHDLELTCIEPKFQKFDIEIKRTALWIGEKEKVAALWKEESPKYILANCLGQSVTEEILRRRFSAIERRNSAGKPIESPVEDKPKGSSSQAHVEDVLDVFSEGKDAAPSTAALETPIESPGAVDEFDFLKQF